MLAKNFNNDVVNDVKALDLSGDEGFGRPDLLRDRPDRSDRPNSASRRKNAPVRGTSRREGAFACYPSIPSPDG